MVGVIEPSKVKRTANALQRSRLKKAEKDKAELEKRLHENKAGISERSIQVITQKVNKELDKAKKAKVYNEPIRHSLHSDLWLAHNDTSALMSEILEESNKTDRWGFYIQKMNLKPLNKMRLNNTVIIKSERSDAQTDVLLGCSDGIFQELQPITHEIEQAMSVISGRQVKVKFKILPDEELLHTPENLQLDIKKRRQKEAYNALILDDKLQMLMGEFDCVLDENEVRAVPYAVAKNREGA